LRRAVMASVNCSEGLVDLSLLSRTFELFADLKPDLGQIIEVLVDRIKPLADSFFCFRPFGFVIRSGDVLISLPKGGHNGNSGQHPLEVSGKVTSFFPRGSVPDRDDAHRFM